MKNYNKNYNFSYVFGAFGVYELLNNKSDYAIEVFYSSKASKKLIRSISDLCKIKSVKLTKTNYNLSKLTKKKNIYVIAKFKKYKMNLSNNKHIVLDRPSDFGNLGTIIRSALGFNFFNIAVIEPSCDFYSPNVIRASMGAFFSINIKSFNSFDEYLKSYKNNTIYSFFTDADDYIEDVKLETNNCSIVFGNESSGLDIKLKKISKPLKIETNNLVDSLNLTIAASIAMYYFR